MLKLLLKVSIAIVLGCVALWGLTLLADGIRVVRQASASVQWPKTQGVVIRSDEIRNDAAYAARAIVRYTAGNGKEYSTSLISFGQTLTPLDRAEGGLQRVRYPDGGKVSVSYDPAKPWIAVLHPGSHSEAFWPMGVAIAFLLPALLCILQLPAVFRNLERSGGQTMALAPSYRGPPPNPMGDVSIIGGLAAALFASLFCGLGVLALSSGLQKMFYGYDSRNWPTTTGEVIVNVGPEAMMRRQSKGDYTIYPPGFLYEYEVAGVKYVNSTRRFKSVQNTGEAGANEAAPQELPAGAKVTVAYFPVDPDISVLQPGLDSGTLILPAIGIVVLCFSLAVFTWVVPSLLRFP